MNVTQRVSVNGWNRVRDLLFAADPTFNGIEAKRLIITNLSATPITVHFSPTGAQPATATDGIPIGAGAITTALGNTLDVENVDLNSCWLNSGVALDIVIAVIGF